MAVSTLPAETDPAEVGVVIPAHNEAGTIGGIVAAVVAAGIGRPLVVADACGDDTADVAALAGAAVVTIDAANKGTAVAAGASCLDTPLILMLDGDLRGLQPGHVQAMATLGSPLAQLVGLVDSGKAGWTAGLPPISGERRIPRQLLDDANAAGSGWQLELGINAAAGRRGIATEVIVLLGVVGTPKLNRKWVGEAADLGAATIVNWRGLGAHMRKAAAR